MKMYKDSNFISVVVYVNNNEDEIGFFIDKIYNYFSENFGKFEIICVNDFSKDDTVKKINEVGKKYTDLTISVINMSFFHGLESSMIAGVDLAIGDFVYEFDSCIIDYDLDIIKKVYEKSLEGNDIVSCSPKKNSNFLSTIFYWILNKTLKSNLKSERFRILSRRAINRVSQNSEHIIYRKAAYSNSGLKYVCVNYDVNKSIKRKNRFMYNQNIAVDSLIAFTDIGYKFSIIIAVSMMIFTILSVIYSLVVKIIGLETAGGWTTLIWILSLSFFMLFSILAVIVKYLSIILRLINNKKIYFFDSINKVNRNNEDD